MDMTIDCTRCAARPAACGDCVVQVLLGPEVPARLTGPERLALGVLAERHLVPPLRHEPPATTRAA